MWYVRDVLYAVLYVRVSCFVVRGCGVDVVNSMRANPEKKTSHCVPSLE